MGDLASLLGPKDYGLRQDKTRKGFGYYGPLKTPSGDDATELSFSFDYNGNEVLAPLLVPGLSKAQIDVLLSGGRITPDIYEMASQHALERLRYGKSPFANPLEIISLPVK
jgi:hypothetical protein